jgi:hypothetical protein
MTRVVLGYKLGSEIHGPVYEVAQVCGSSLTGPSVPLHIPFAHQPPIPIELGQAYRCWY